MAGDNSESAADLSSQLIFACDDGDLGNVKYLVEVEHIDPHLCRDAKYDDTPLHWASQATLLIATLLIATSTL